MGWIAYYYVIYLVGLVVTGLIANYYRTHKYGPGLREPRRQDVIFVVALWPIFLGLAIAAIVAIMALCLFLQLAAPRDRRTTEST